MNSPEIFSDIPAVLRVLKSMLKAKGLHYSDLASALGKSESSLKRYLSGRRLTLADLEAMCRIVGVTLGEFYEIASKELAKKSHSLTDRQEMELAADPELMMVFVLLLLGRTFDEIVEDLTLDDTHLFPLLMRLERLNLIKIHPGNRIRLLVSHKIDIPPGSPIRDGFNDVLKKDFMDIDYRSEASHWSVLMAKLSPSSLATLQNQVGTLEGQVRALADKDRKNGEATSWYFTLWSALEVDLSRYVQRLRAERVRKRGQAGQGLSDAKGSEERVLVSTGPSKI